MPIKINVTGIVQGVGFRPFIYRMAKKFGLRGYVRNKGDAGVDIILEGKKTNINLFLSKLKKNPPPLAKIHKIKIIEITSQDQYTDFIIEKSSLLSEESGSIIPPDINSSIILFAIIGIILFFLIITFKFVSPDARPSNIARLNLFERIYPSSIFLPIS